MTLILCCVLIVCLYSGTVAGLLDDVAELQPHMFMSVPRVYNKLHDAVMAAVNSAGPQQQQLFHAAFEHRKAALQAGGAGGSTQFSY